MRSRDKALKHDPSILMELEYSALELKIAHVKLLDLIRSVGVGNDD